MFPCLRLKVVKRELEHWPVPCRFSTTVKLKTTFLAVISNRITNDEIDCRPRHEPIHVNFLFTTRGIAVSTAKMTVERRKEHGRIGLKPLIARQYPVIYWRIDLQSINVKLGKKDRKFLEIE